ncbi:MAG: iron-containing alcohol dehydrogenase [Nocardioidaceae bacterium]|nr:iron-containing alcohol dehydrogenase [Nocardioidaceae bacterium]
MSSDVAQGAGVDIDAITRGLAERDPDGRLVDLGIETIDLSAGAHTHVADAVERAIGSDPAARVVLLQDEVLIERAGVDLKADVLAQLADRYDCHTTVLSDGHPRLHADADVLDAATGAVAGADCVVAIGGGTVSDVAKVACERAGGMALVVVQTAASVDGFTDNVSVVLANGVKRTIPSQWPHTVLADPETIRDAPQRLNASGFGEALSMFTAPADWYLAHLVGLDDTYHEAPRHLLTSLGRDLSGWSSGVPRREPEAIATLTRLLAVRGIATGVAGTTAILSGSEHLVSHMLDLHHGARGEEIGLHGEQVGVASPVAAAVWAVLRRRLAEGLPALTIPDEDVARRQVSEAFDHLDPTGATTAECWKAYSGKLARCAELLPHLQQLVDGWAEHDAKLDELVAPPAELLGALADAQVPATFASLTPSVSDDLARWAVRSCLFMRDRFTAVDLLALSGGWDDATVDEVLAASLGVGDA